jgi:hypothetical protein
MSWRQQCPVKWGLSHRILTNRRQNSDMADKEVIEKARRRAEELYRSGQFLCSEAVFLVANEFLGYPVPNEIVRLASGFRSAWD